jgi:ABC-type glycerol-3-phosphate transport system substrate-binding protein
MADVTRRHLFKTGAGLLVASGLTGACAPGTSGRQSSGGAGKPQGKISVWLHESSAYHKVFQNLIEQYKHDYPAVEVTAQFIPVAQYDTKLLTAFTGGNPPDICKIGAWSLPDHVAKNRLMPVAPASFGKSSLSRLAADYEPGAFKPVTVRGQAYGLPIDFNTALLLYRKDRFKLAGLDPDKPPATWEEVEAYSKKLTNADASKVGMQWVIGQPQWALLQLTALVGGLGGSIVSPGGTKGTLSTSAGIKALEYVSRIGNAKLQDPLFGAGLFAKGASAMTLSGYFALSLMRQLGKGIELGTTYGVAPVPTWQGGRDVVPAYTWCWSVPKASGNQFTAWHFISYLQRRQVQTEQIKDASIITPVKDWQSLLPGDTTLAQMGKEYPAADFGPQIGPWNEMAKTLSDTLTAVALRQTSPKDAAARFDSQMGTVL